MLDLEPIRAGIEKHGRALVLSEASSCAIDPSAVKEELEEAGFRWIEEDGNLYAALELSKRARQCLCGDLFNSWNAIQQLTNEQCQSLLYSVLCRAVDPNSPLSHDPMELARGFLGEEVVKELQPYRRSRHG